MLFTLDTFNLEQGRFIFIPESGQEKHQQMKVHASKFELMAKDAGQMKIHQIYFDTIGVNKAKLSRVEEV